MGLPWNKELSKIEVTSDDKDKLRFSHGFVSHHDATKYRARFRWKNRRDNKIHVAEGFDYYRFSFVGRLEVRIRSLYFD